MAINTADGMDTNKKSGNQTVLQKQTENGELQGTRVKRIPLVIPGARGVVAVIQIFGTY